MKILPPIDDSKFAEAVIQAAILQVRQDHSQVLVLHVVDWNNFMPSPFPRIGEQPLYSAHQLESIIENETRKAHVLVKDAGDRLRLAGFDVSTSVREGDVKTVILDCAAEWAADLIIVGSHGRKGIARVVLGSVSEAVARYAQCSVVIARLPGGA
jgi:nucleotide-binding universal stress UspA family protein